MHRIRSHLIAMLLELPDKFIKALLSDWLRVTDWGTLDKAVCSWQYRGSMLHTFKSLSLATTESIDLLQWIALRKVSINYVRFTQQTAVVRSAREHFCNHITALNVQYSPIEATAIINRCTNLTWLTWLRDFDTTNLHFTALKQLQHLHVSKKKGGGWKAIADQCRELRSLTNESQVKIDEAECVEKILQANPQLHTLNINCGFSKLVLGVYPSLTSLTIRTNDLTTGRLLRNNQSLVDLHVQGDLNLSFVKLEGYLSVSCRDTTKLVIWMNSVGSFSGLQKLVWKCEGPNTSYLFSQLIEGSQHSLSSVTIHT